MQSVSSSSSSTVKLVSISLPVVSPSLDASTPLQLFPADGKDNGHVMVTFSSL